MHDFMEARVWFVWKNDVLFGKMMSCHLKASAVVSPLPQDDFIPCQGGFGIYIQ
jgi:hypothetical protein